jgi:hypothetical protein
MFPGDKGNGKDLSLSTISFNGFSRGQIRKKYFFGTNCEKTMGREQTSLLQ